MAHPPFASRRCLAILVGGAVALPVPSTAQDPSNGPAVGMPAAINTLDHAGNFHALLFKPAGLDGNEPRGIDTALPGPGQPLVTPQALAWSGPAWSERVVATSPPSQSNHTMAYDPIGQQVVLLGSGPMSDMWSWDDGLWTPVVGASLPPPRISAATETDWTSGRVVLFAGEDTATNVPSSDTWTWDGFTWTQESPSTSPSARSHHDMAFDSPGRVILFGGADSGGLALGDTWAWDGSNWTALVPLTSPSPRQDHAMAYDPVRGQLVLFGGRDQTNTLLGDTWEWDGNTWTQLLATGGPSPRGNHAMAYDPERQRVILTGHTWTETTCDSWEWDGTHWCELQRTTAHHGRVEHAMAFHYDEAEMVMFGGMAIGAGVLVDDTWTLDQTVRALVINDFSLGIDFVPAGDPNYDEVAVPDKSWIGLAFSVREGALGAAGSRLSQEPSAGKGSDLFTYVFHGSDQDCLPGHQVGDVTRAVNADEGLAFSGVQQDVNGVDVFVPAYNSSANLSLNSLVQNPSVYFTVARAGLASAPPSWWGGEPNKSAASILVTHWDPVASSWSCPEIWIAHDQIMVSTMPMGPLVPLGQDEEIDALAIGRNDADGSPDFPPEYLLFSTKATLPNGSPTAAPDQLMIVDVSGLDGPLIGLVLRVLVSGSATPVSTEIGLEPPGGGYGGDDIDGCSTWDPCTLSTSTFTPRGIFDRLVGQHVDPALAFVPVEAFLGTTMTLGDAAATYRHDIAGVDTLTTVTTRDVSGLGILLVDLNPPVPLTVVATVSVLLIPPNDSVQIGLAIPAALSGTAVMLHWVSMSVGPLDARRSSMLIQF